MSTASRMQKDAMEKMTRALALIDEAKKTMSLANRFGEEPESGTILVFDKIFSNRGEALESRGLNFDPDILVPNLSRRQIERLNVVVFDSSAEFAEAQKVGYRYVAIRIGGTWFTSSAGKAKMKWDQLVEFIGDSQCWKVTGLEEIPLDTPEVIEAAPVAASTEAAETDLADLLASNRKDVAAIVRKLTANGRKQTPAVLIDNIVRELKALKADK